MQSTQASGHQRTSTSADIELTSATRATCACHCVKMDKDRLAAAPHQHLLEGSHQLLRRGPRGAVAPPAVVKQPLQRGRRGGALKRPQALAHHRRRKLLPAHAADQDVAGLGRTRDG